VKELHVISLAWSHRKDKSFYVVPATDPEGALMCL
jgi:hypothetical protein